VEDVIWLTHLQLKQQLIIEFGLRTETKEKPIMRAEDEFECLKTLYTSPEMVFDMEAHRLAMYRKIFVQSEVDDLISTPSYS
jgi:hypothetical protein